MDSEAQGITVSAPLSATGVQRPEDPTSFAQVESFVCQKTGTQNSSELKLDISRGCRIVMRVTRNEQAIIGTHAKKAGMSVSNYIRLTILNNPGLDPDRNKYLRKLDFELTKQGTNLNQIAKHLNAGTATIDQGNSMLAIISRSMLSAHRAVREALTQGKTYP
jgi:hypothetical protein